MSRSLSRRWVAALATTLAIAGAALATGALNPEPRRAAEPVEVVDEVAVTPTNIEAQYSSNSPVLAAEPGLPDFVVMANRLDSPDFSCSLQLSGNGGRTWLTANPVPKLPEGAEKCYNPEVAFDADGTLYYLFVGLAGAGNRPMGAYLVSSTDRGVSFTPPRRVLGPLEFAVRMAIDPDLGNRGRIHLLWIHATSDPVTGGFGPPPNPILAAYSDDGGTTFSEPVQVSAPNRERVVAPALAVGPDGTVHVAYYDLGRDAIDYQGLEGDIWDEPWSLVLSSSSDGGAKFSNGTVVDDEIRAAERVMLIFTMAPPALIGGSDGFVCSAWTDARHGDADVLARCSSDGGRTWAVPRRLNDDRRGNGVTQYLPRLSLSPQGRLDAIFFDRRDDPRNVRNHTYLTYSTDDGRRFAKNRRISGDPSDTRIGQQYVHAAARGQFEIGGRLGLLSFDDGAVAAWPDTRHWAAGAKAHDLFSATVSLPDPAGQPPISRLVGGAAIAGMAGLAGAAVARRRGKDTPVASS